MMPGPLLNAIASLMALWLFFRWTMDSGSSKGSGMSLSQLNLGRSGPGEPCTELLFVVSCVWGESTGDACCELDVKEEALIAEVGTEVEGMVGRKLV